MKPTADNFIKFVKAEAEKNPGREIDHTCWQTCAIGSFFNDAVKQPIGDWDNPDAAFMRSLGRKSQQLRSDLSYGRKIGDDGNPIGGRTYGDLAKIIDGYVPQRTGFFSRLLGKLGVA